MKVTLGILTGITLAWAAAAIYRPAIRWALTHNAPTTPADHQTKSRTWTGGIMTEGPW